jgi:tellurite resistance protein TerC
VGVKMLLTHTAYKVDTLVSLGVIVGILAVAVIASLVFPKKPIHFESGPDTL